VPEFPEKVHTGEKHLRFAYSESKIAIEAMDRPTILQDFNNWIAV
jgi:hypothetical protein